MGVPAFFRWLQRKYPSIVVECIEKCEIDYSDKNPNGVEFDNLYIDMNGIIHPCTHPEDKPHPTNEDEMMVAIFECIDRIFKIVRPRKLFYLAVDGVAPRAKMNQQRSRRFRAAKEAEERAEQISEARKKLEAQGVELLPLVDKHNIFDSNCITPGTSFMSRLTKCLNYYIHDRIANDIGWKQIKVILSDASVPGEGEHKIMDFIRRQRAHPDHDPNTHHCICGADADLIMLGLATHEPYFTIIREEFVRTVNICLNCGMKGHLMVNCKGIASGMDSVDGSETEKLTKKFIFIRLNVLREYLEQELSMSNVSFEYDFERAIDDWVFLCFFVGNDFLPHLPSLEIQEGAIDRLVNLYKKTLPHTNGFITHNGDINLDILQVIMNDLGTIEDEIFMKRHSKQENHRWRACMKKKQKASERVSVYEVMEVEPESGPVDDTKLWETGYKERYYKLKFNIDSGHNEYYKLAFEYVRGLCWVLKYYYQGCASWKWYYPYYYAPFASDFVNISQTDIFFEKGTRPFSPLVQLMSVFPPSSSSLVPSQWSDLMTNPLSPILDFYPKEFRIDFNGKRFAWQGVALLPFVNENRLKQSLSSLYSHLNETEIDRNKYGYDRLYMGVEADCFEFINNLDPVVHEKKKNHIISAGVNGDVYIIANEFFQGETIPAPIKGVDCVKMNSAICVAYCDPQYPDDYIFKSCKLFGVREPPRVLPIKHHLTSPSYSVPVINEQIYFRRNINLWKYNNTVTSRNYPLVETAPLDYRVSISDSGHSLLRHAISNSYYHNKQRTKQFIDGLNFFRFHPYNRHFCDETHYRIRY